MTRGKATDRTWFPRWLRPLAAVLGIAVAAYLLFRAFGDLDAAEVRRAAQRLSRPQLAIGAAAAAASYFVLTGFDALGLAYARRRLAYRRIAFTSFVALAIGHTVGLAVLSTDAIRLRLYGAFGIRPRSVARVIGFSGATVLLGLCSGAGAAALLRPRLTAQVAQLPARVAFPLGIALLAMPLGYLAVVAWRRRLRLWGRTLRLPTPRLALGQIALGSGNFLLVAAVLHQMLAAAAVDVGYSTVAAMYALATVAALLTHVPGGLGVLEATVLSLLPGSRVLAALLAFRLVYHLGPFIVACVLLGGFELWRLGCRRQQGGESARRRR